MLRHFAVTQAIAAPPLDFSIDIDRPKLGDSGFGIDESLSNSILCAVARHDFDAKRGNFTDGSRVLGRDTSEQDECIRLQDAPRAKAHIEWSHADSHFSLLGCCPILERPHDLAQDPLVAIARTGRQDHLSVEKFDLLGGFRKRKELLFSDQPWRRTRHIGELF